MHYFGQVVLGCGFT